MIPTTLIAGRTKEVSLKQFVATQETPEAQMLCAPCTSLSRS
jgi:hypothetical protein